MTTVEIQFATLPRLWDFWQFHRSDITSVSITKNRLACECSEAQIKLALSAYVKDNNLLLSFNNQSRCLNLPIKSPNWRESCALVIVGDNNMFCAIIISNENRLDSISDREAINRESPLRRSR